MYPRSRTGRSALARGRRTRPAGSSPPSECVSRRSIGADARELPLPLGRGGHCGLVLPCARTGGLAAHLRGAFLLLDFADHERTRLALQVSISTSLWRWAEVGVTWFASAANGAQGIDLRQGPLTLWGRLSPPPLAALLSERQGEGLFLAGHLEYAVARPPFDHGGGLLPEGQLFAAIAEYRRWRVAASLSGGIQLADGGRYRGAQAGGGIWLTLVRSLGMQLGGEVLGRWGQLEGEPTARAGWMVLVGLAALDEWGVQGGVGYLHGGGRGLPRSSLLVQMGYSIGPGYRRPPPEPPVTGPEPLLGLALWLAGYRDPIVGADGNLWSDDGRRPLYRFGVRDPYHPGPVRQGLVVDPLP